MAQLRLVKNIDVQRSSSPKNLFAVDDLVFFEANKNELWLSDGTGVGTRFVQDFGNDVISRNLGGEEGSGSTQSGKLAMANLDGRLLFRGYDRDKGSEVFVSDGTEVGTQLLKDLRREGSSQAKDFTVVNQRLFFSAENDRGNGNFLKDQRSLFVTDGSRRGTSQIPSFFSEGDNLPEQAFLTEFNGDLYFRGYAAGPDGQRSGSEYALYCTDGETLQTDLVFQVNQNSSLAGRVMDLEVVGNNLYFYGTEAGEVTQGGGVIYRLNGDEGGVQQLGTNVWDFYSYRPQGFTSAGGRLFFFGGLLDQEDIEINGQRANKNVGLWVADDSVEGSRRLKLFENSFLNDNVDEQLTPVGNRVFFVADDGNTGRELWSSDGTTAGTRLVRDLYPGSESSDPDDFLVKGNELYFTAKNPAIGRELWKTDGTAAGTQRITDLNPGKEDSNPSDLALMGNTVYFSATNQADDRELYAYGDPLPNYTPNPVAEATLDADAVLTKEGKGKDKIKGTKQDDIIGAGSGADQMKGGRGADDFYWGFDFSVSYGKKKADRVTDFKTGQGDQIVLDEDAFGGFGVSFTFSVASNKKELRQASRAGADLIYFEAKGFLYFDQNEEGKGYGDGGVFAVLNKKPELEAADIAFTSMA